MSSVGDTDAQAYFTQAEWNCMVTIEKNRVNNMLRNYKCLHDQGIDVKPPAFILRGEARKKQQQLKYTPRCNSEVRFEQLPVSNSDFELVEGQTSYATYREGGTESFAPDEETISWRNVSTNCDGNCSTFCQYCYIFKHLILDDSMNKSLSPGSYSRSIKNESLPLTPSNSLGCQCGCQSLVKTKFFPPHNEQQTNKISCQECGQKFAKLKYLKNHLKRFSLPGESRPFKCVFCNHSFVHEKNRKFHERIHAHSKLVPCCHCPRSFADLTTARVHIDETHKDKMYVCHDCGMSYSNSSHLMRHKREVRKPYPHQCYVCGHRYFTAISLSRHKIHHSRVEPFKCKVCLKIFSSKTHLTKHIKSGRSERKYECPSCKIKFMARKSLKKHEKVFTGDRPYKCVVCDHSYSSRQRLKLHVKVHY